LEIVLALLFLIFLGIFFYKWQHAMIFTPTFYREGHLDERFTPLEIQMRDGIVLEGVVYEPQGILHPKTLLFFGGRSQDSVGLIERLAQRFQESRIVTFNYRSYGKSQGNINEQHLLNDALTCADFVAKEYGAFFVLGYSIGSSAAAFVSSKREVAGVFLVGSFDSIASVAKERYGVSMPWILRYRFDNRAYVKTIEANTYLFASKDDKVTPIKNARNLASHVKNLAHYEEFSDLDHKEILWHEAVLEKVRLHLQQEKYL
jgi:hypothetical protein